MTGCESEWVWNRMFAMRQRIFIPYNNNKKKKKKNGTKRYKLFISHNHNRFCCCCWINYWNWCLACMIFYILFLVFSFTLLFRFNLVYTQLLMKCVILVDFGYKNFFRCFIHFASILSCMPIQYTSNLVHGNTVNLCAQIR